MAISVTTMALLLFSIFAFFHLAVIRDDTLPARVWPVIRSLVAAMVALGIASAILDNPPTAGFVRWHRVLIRGLMLLAVGCNAVLCSFAFNWAADMFMRGGGNSSAASSSACAVLAVALNLPLVWIVFFPVLLS